jgi:hypothetical protein
MKLEIRSFADAGQQKKERVIIKALSDTDVGEYLLMCSDIAKDGSATAGRKTAYWFPDKEIRAGDLVVLYSKSGTDSEKQLESGGTAHSSIGDWRALCGLAETEQCSCSLLNGNSRSPSNFVKSRALFLEVVKPVHSLPRMFSRHELPRSEQQLQQAQWAYLYRLAQVDYNFIRGSIHKDSSNG